MKRKSVKLMTAVLACVGLLALAGCGKKDPYTVYEEASKKSSALESMELNSDMDMTLSAAGQSMDISSSTKAKMSGVNSENMLADMDVTLETGGQSMTMKSYYKDGYYFTESGGQKIKYAMDLAQMQSQLESSALKTDLKKEDFKEISMEKKDKDYVITFNLSGETMSSLVDSTLSSLGDFLNSADLKMEIADIAGTATVNKDGYFSDMTMKMPLTITIQDQEMTMDMNLSATYVNPGKEVTVEIPDNLDDYLEIDMSALGIQGDTGAAGGAEGSNGEDAADGEDAQDGAFTDDTQTGADGTQDNADADSTDTAGNTDEAA